MSTVWNIYLQGVAHGIAQASSQGQRKTRFSEGTKAVGNSGMITLQGRLFFPHTVSICIYFHHRISWIKLERRDALNIYPGVCMIFQLDIFRFYNFGKSTKYITHKYLM